MPTHFTQLHKHNRGSALYIFFDEIQYHKAWEVHLKSLVDSYPDYRFIATGSAAAALRLKSQESGAGRFTDFFLPPLTFHEYLTFIGENENLITIDHDEEEEAKSYSTNDIQLLKKHFVDYLNFGGYPDVTASPKPPIFAETRKGQS